MQTRLTLLGLMSLWLLIYGCSPKPQNPQLMLTLSPLDSLDTLARLIYWGAETRREDTIRLDSTQPIALYPDTVGLRHLLVVHAGGASAYYYALRSGQWIDTLPPASPLPVGLSSEALPLDEADARGKYHTLEELVQPGRALLLFSDARLATHTRAERDSLRKVWGKDSVRFVYMMLSPSDSASLAQIKRDSLDGVVYSDTLGMVSRLRRVYGLDRQRQAVCLLLDTLGRVEPLTAISSRRR